MAFHLRAVRLEWALFAILKCIEFFNKSRLHMGPLPIVHVRQRKAITKSPNLKYLSNTLPNSALFYVERYATASLYASFATKQPQPMFGTCLYVWAHAPRASWNWKIKTTRKATVWSLMKSHYCWAMGTKFNYRRPPHSFCHDGIVRPKLQAHGERTSSSIPK